METLIFIQLEYSTESIIAVDNLLIKKAGGSRPIGTNNVTTSVDDGKSRTLTHKSHASSKSIKPKRKRIQKKK